MTSKLGVNTAAADHAMPESPVEAAVSGGSDDSTEEVPMTESQIATLRRVAHEAFEPEAFSRQLSRAEAQRRIDALEAKLRLQDGPPHTL
jgi:Protein of unknown function (DUF3072)